MNRNALTTFSNYPHFDDFNPANNFYRVLFKPGVSVQTRELNQLQSMLQEQIGNLADHSIKDKTAVSGGKINLNNSVSFLKLADGAVLSRTTTEYNEEVQFETTEGIRGRIQFAIDASEENPATLYVKYNSASESGQHIPDGGTDITLLYPDGNTEMVRIASGETYSGYGTVAELKESVYYIKRTLVRVPRQALVLERYNSVDIKDFNVGVLITERVISAQEDASLYDNALGTPNEMAPGADRYQITGMLAEKSQVPPELIDNFIEIIKSEKGIVQEKPKENAAGPEIPTMTEMLARRTMDESGDYVVDTFDLDIREHLKIGDNNGVYSFNDGGDADKLVAQLDPGVAYIRGYEVRIPQTSYLDVEKARDTAIMTNSYTNPNFNNYVIVNTVTGSVTPGDIIDIQNTSRATVGSAIVHGLEALDNNRLKIYASVISGEIGTNVTGYFVKGSAFNNALVGFNSSIETYRLNNDYYPLIMPLPYGYSKTTSLNNCSIYKTYDATVNSSAVITLANDDPTEHFTESTSDYYVYIKGHKGGLPVGVTTIKPDNNQVSISVSNLATGSIVGTHNAVVVAKVNVRSPQFKTKTVKSRVDNVSGALFASSGRAKLAMVDGYRLKKVSYVSGGTTNDVTSKFNFDDGARDTHYENASVGIKPGLSSPTNVNYRVEYEYLEHSASGDFFTVDSYASLQYEDIPTYVDATGEMIFLGSAYDFRPAVAASATDGTVRTINKEARGFVAVDEEVISDITYYLPRQDRIMVTASGVLQVIKGLPGFEPVLPPELDDGITLYKLVVLPYTFNINDVITTKLNHRRYTMKDIGRLEARISNVEEVALLNKLESDTATVNFTDRFKSGYVVDNFAESFTGDVDSPHWGVAYDLLDPSIRPKSVSDFVEVAPRFTESSGVKYHPKTGIITLDYTVEPYIVQDLASDIVLLQPYMIHGWGEARITIKPSMDIWKEHYIHTKKLYTSNVNRLDDIIVKTSKTVDDAWDI